MYATAVERMLECKVATSLFAVEIFFMCTPTGANAFYFPIADCTPGQSSHSPPIVSQLRKRKSSFAYKEAAALIFGPPSLACGLFLEENGTLVGRDDVVVGIERRVLCVKARKSVETLSLEIGFDLVILLCLQL